jgi:hypothetical protein
MTLKFAKALLKHPSADLRGISPDSSDFRAKVAKQLLSTTFNGTEVLNRSNGESNRLFNLLDSRPKPAERSPRVGFEEDFGAQGDRHNFIRFIAAVSSPTKDGRPEAFCVYDFQLASLAPKHQIVSCVIDTFMDWLVYKNSNCGYVYAPIAFHTSINGKEHTMPAVFPNDAAPKKKILFTTCFNSHYWLNAIDRKTFKVDIYDSLRPSSKTAASGRVQYRDGFKAALETVIPESKGRWSFQYQSCTQQRDAFSCGAWVMAFAKELVSGTAENIPLLDQSVPSALREEIVKELLDTTTFGKTLREQCNENLDMIYSELNRADYGPQCL